MKKTFTLLWMAAALWTAASCSKSEMDIPEADILPSVESADSVKVNISVSSLTPDTKAVKAGWEKGDILNVYLDDNRFLTKPDFTLTYDGSAWKSSSLGAAVVARLKASDGEIYGFWEDSNSCISNDAWKKIESGVSSVLAFPDGDKAKTTGFEVHMVATFPATYYTYDNGVLEASIDTWSIIPRLQIVVSGLTYSPGRYTMYSEGVEVPRSIFSAYENNTGALVIYTSEYDSSGKDGNRIAGIKNQDGVAFYAEVYLGEWEHINLYLLDNQEGRAYVFEKEGRIFAPYGKLYPVKIPFSKFREVQLMDAVDLGLSVKWGTCNLGAGSAHDAGDYYAWGETEPYYTPGHALDYACDSWKDGKTGYNWWPSYRFAMEPTEHIPYPLGKYTVPGDGSSHSGNWWTLTGGVWKFIGDGYDTLLKEDDPAHEALGGLWHTPTAEQWQELMDNCYWKWNEDDYGENVWVVTSRKKAGASIIIPVVGWRTDDKLNERYNYSAYWSSSVNEWDPTEAKCLFFGGVATPSVNSLLRSYGLSIRPVKENTN